MEIAVPDGLRILETLGWHPGEGPRRAARHLARMEATAGRLGYGFPRARIEALLGHVRGLGPLRVRIALARDGTVEITDAPLGVAAPWRVQISAVRVAPGDPFLGIKTTARAVYDEARAALPPGVDEAILLNTAGAVTEGTITNLFVARGGVLLTPPASAGLLPGVLRAELLESGQAREALLGPEDLRRGDLFMGNSLRGLIPARLV